MHNRAWRGLGAEQLGWMWTASHMGHFHPLTWMSFGLDWELWARDAASRDGLDAGALHATNVALHALTAVAVLFAVRRLFALGCDLRAGPRLAGATVAALFFAVHPLRVESVAWVTERRDVLSGLLFVLAVLAWLRFAPRARAFESRSGESRSGTHACAALGLAAAAVGAFELGAELAGPRLALGLLGVPALVAVPLLLTASALAAARIANADRSARAAWFLAALAALCLSLCAKAWGIVMPALLLVLDVWPLARTSGHARPGFGARLALLAAEKAPCFRADRDLRAAGGLGPGPRRDRDALARRPRPARAPRPGPLRPRLVPVEDALSERAGPDPRAAGRALALRTALRPRGAPGRRGHAGCRRRPPPRPGPCSPPGSPSVSSSRRCSGSRRAARSWWPSATATSPACRSRRSSAGASAGSPRTRREDPPRSPSGSWCWLRSAGRPPRARGSGATRARSGRPPLQCTRTARPRCCRSAPPASSRPRARSTPRAGARSSRGRSSCSKRASSARATRAFSPTRSAPSVSSPSSSPSAPPSTARPPSCTPPAPAPLAIELGLDPLRFDQILGAARLMAGRPEDALAPLARVLERLPDEVPVLLDHGVALALAGRVDEGLAELERAATLAPSSAEAWGKLGQARLQSGDRAGAIEAFRRVLALEPDHAAARARLDTLGVQ